MPCGVTYPSAGGGGGARGRDCGCLRAPGHPDVHKARGWPQVRGVCVRARVCACVCAQAEDGRFWMELSDFVPRFECLDLCTFAKTQRERALERDLKEQLRKDAVDFEARRQRKVCPVEGQHEVPPPPHTPSGGGFRAVHVCPDRGPLQSTPSTGLPPLPPLPPVP